VLESAIVVLIFVSVFLLGMLCNSIMELLRCLTRSSCKSPSHSSSTSSDESLRGNLRLMLTLILLAFAVLVLVFASGCGSRTVFIPEESPIRIGPDTRSRVYTLQQGQWVLSDNRVTIPEGWYAVPPSYVKDE
jgi:multidrug efflux pump subunit AcrB